MKKKSTFISYLVAASLVVAASTVQPLWFFAGF